MLEIKNISKTYKKGSEEFIALDNVSININKGDYVSVTGASGAGKSTLLNIIGALIVPDEGELIFKGNNIFKQKTKFKEEYRKKHIGFMFQQFHLMPYLTVIENIKLGCNSNRFIKNIDKYINTCSLTYLVNKYPSELRWGEKQRVAFIRAIISEPDLLLADEPTGNLDPENSSILMTLIKDYQESGGTVVLVSHDPSIAGYSNLNIRLDKGRKINSSSSPD